MSTRVPRQSASGSLTHIVHARGLWSKGEVATILTPKEQFLTLAYGRRAIHGDVTNASVLINISGTSFRVGNGLVAIAGPVQRKLRPR